MGELRGLKLPVAETAGNSYPCLAACTVALAITVALKMASNWHANGSSKEESMDTKKAYRKMVRTSVLITLEAIGRAAIGGLLAA